MSSLIQLRSFQIVLIVLIVSACAPGRSATPLIPLSPGIAQDIAYLAGPALEGRGTGTAGSDSAAEYLLRFYDKLQLPGAFPVTCNNAAQCTTHFQFFMVAGQFARNVGAFIAGNDPLLRHQFVVVGAHYDHLGRSVRGALDPRAGNAIRPGADDNASGTAAVMELARRLSADPPRRSILLLHFGAEELGLVGSRTFTDRPAVTGKSMILMINLDMVGRMRDRMLYFEASNADLAVRELIESAAKGARLRTREVPIFEARSDNLNFRRVGIPAIFLSTGTHADYHRKSDIISRLDLRGLELVVGVTEQVIRAVANKR